MATGRLRNYLLAYKADVNAKDDHGQTPLLEAAARGDLEIVELLLANKADVNAKDDRTASSFLTKTRRMAERFGLRISQRMR
jgi:ankyrin repeat protein